MQISASKVEKQIGEVIRGVSDSVPEESVIRLVSEYRAKVLRRMIALYPDRIPELRSHEDMFVSVKYDGMFCAFYYRAEEGRPKKKTTVKKKNAEDPTNPTNPANLANLDDNAALRFNSMFMTVPANRVIAGLPINTELEQLLEKRGIRSILLAGEMISTPADLPDFSARCRVYDVTQAIRSNDTADFQRIGYRIFDILEINGEPVQRELFESRYERMSNLFPDEGRIAYIPQKTMNKSQLMHYYNHIVQEKGYEGLVVRSGSLIFKIKPVHTLDAVIIGAICGRVESRLGETQLASALFALRYPDGTYQVVAAGGGGLDDEMRRVLWDQLEFTDRPDFVIPARDGRIFRMVVPKLVAQLRYLDVISNSSGLSTDSPHLTFDETSAIWSKIGSRKFVRLISPRFDPIPIRTDKSNLSEEVRISQITDLFPFSVDSQESITELPKSTILARQVYVKKDMIRKFLLWQTNKQEHGYPGYVVYFLDYSPNRKSPVDRKVKCTHDRVQAKSLFKGWVKSEVKKGWRLHSEG